MLKADFIDYLDMYSTISFIC